MAYFVRKKGSVYVYFHNPKTGTNVPLSRSETRHLDQASDEQVKSWIQNKELTLGYEQKVTQKVLSPKFEKLVEKYCKYLAIETEMDSATISNHKRVLLRDVLVFFINKRNLTEPATWIYHNEDFYQYLRHEKKCTYWQIVRANAALKGFWEQLIREKIIHPSLTLKLVTPRKQKTDDNHTPLKSVITPEMAIKSANSLTGELKLAVMIAYFFSLRPQEIFALRRIKFQRGSSVSKTEAVIAMQHLKIYGDLVVYINEQRGKSGDFKKPKSYSTGYVASFNAQASMMIRDYIRPFDETTALFTKGNDFYYKKLRRSNLGFTFKDLRRSSIYFLAHNTEINLPVLQKHARHKRLETTNLYMRRPFEELIRLTGDEI